ncbi:MAG: hypothetical protein FWE25_00465 [Lachnospiraceae bacterium]|nr:hypothetical protein [Lachnospiraceae bacterium]
MENKKKKPFRFMEKMIIVVIITVLVGGAVMSIVAYVNPDAKNRCACNRQVLLEELQRERGVNSNINMSEVIHRMQYEVVCPSSGIYTEIAVTLGSGFIGGAVCSVHGGYDIIPE